MSNSVEGPVKNQQVHDASNKTSPVTDKAGCPKARITSEVSCGSNRMIVDPFLKFLNLFFSKSGRADDLLPLQDDHDEGADGLPEEGIHRRLLLQKLPV